ncbi:carbon-nitrogen hydrolase [Yarrowia lipolytica]|jgi:predicted amidohydrolase|uniref:YALI0F29139p n=2 Tax=Yarrowia lipolytica TaxID=4952 RepID=Q6C005_YARLI|nr:YALI0F29139p [Yarrowia lipolytica CLIB122]AOW07854.1 hypothetical protein YALI1_F36733g [Yarrowia lipolytica]KAB8279954.1 carbon-nitrogen hydrolase [Yarrowia lipolytica]KAE8168946.1 carbon-nitrogen hydrolase [Yarrowia lipolytica]KAJ8055105.1 carbon-nitrogen hydrolase [Yarrowia lipolytica]QNP99617.1 Putative hydrolase nit2 [Yarrowia lipolytica]|eukprot:XP_506007.1 YALI0F29139p [Yarrowia lipolytica CLIB122]
MTLAAVGQFCATNSLTHNASIVAGLVHRAAALGAQALFLPEASDYISGSPKEGLSLARNAENSPMIAAIREAQKEIKQSGMSGIEVSVGVHELSSSSDRVRNTLLWLDSNGDIVNRYQKVHLFDVEVPNGPILQESKSVEPGSELPKPFETPVGTVGPAICYDIRFPELALLLRKQGAQILQFPSAFTVRTGAAHWHVLARARAIDTQCYVMMPALVGKHTEDGKRESYGHAMIIDPWGTVLAEASDIDSSAAVIVADINLEQLKKVRTNMPLWDQRRNDVYSLLEVKK